MKKLFVVAIISMMIMACSVAAFSYAGVALNIMPVSDNGSYHTPQVGWLTDDGTGNATLDGKDASDLADSASVPAGTIELDVVNSVIGSQVQYDMRAPIAAVDATQIWRLKASVKNPNPFGDMVGANFSLAANFQTGFAPTAAPDAISSVFYILNGNFSTLAACQTAVGFAGGKYTDTGTAILTKLTPDNAGAGFESAAFSLAAPQYNADDDTWSAPNKYFTVFAVGIQNPSVPEPGSLLAMFSGLIGLVGFGIRRRRA